VNPRAWVYYVASILLAVLVGSRIEPMRDALAWGTPVDVLLAGWVLIPFVVFAGLFVLVATGPER
jgi:hypothetical protein